MTQDRDKPSPRIETSQVELRDIVGFETTKVDPELLAKVAMQDAFDHEQTMRLDPESLRKLHERARGADAVSREPDRVEHATPAQTPRTLGHDAPLEQTSESSKKSTKDRNTQATSTENQTETRDTLPTKEDTSPPYKEPKSTRSPWPRRAIGLALASCAALLLWMLW